jgi:phage shock protein E
MRITILSFIALLLCCALAAAEENGLPNPLIDYNGFLDNAVKVRALRNQRRISEADFLRLAAEPGTIIFDARSDSKFAMLHVQGAKHLSLPDVTADELARIIPSKATRLLIYCNNNFNNEPQALPPKAVAASLNLYTFNTLYSYGYTNIYELGPLIDINKSILPFEGSLVAASNRASTSSSRPVTSQ